MEHTCHLLKVVLGKRREQRDLLQELDAPILPALHQAFMEFHKLLLGQVGEVRILSAADGSRAVTISQIGLFAEHISTLEHTNISHFHFKKNLVKHLIRGLARIFW